jgi:ribosomal protein L11 methyltransferase
MNYIKLIFEKLSEDQMDMLTALFSDENIHGMEQMETDMLVYFSESDFNENYINELIAPFSFTYRKEITEHEHWNATWESNFEPITIGNLVGVRAHFHPKFENMQYDKEITPKMSFGTGHHESTQKMMEYQIETECENKSVFDFGCGTGVLAIFAKLKGASKVIGIDNDAWSVENAIENCQKNNCNDIQISINDIATIQGPFDIIEANINLNILLFYMNTLKELLMPTGDLFLSGILIEDIPTIEKALTPLNLVIVSSKQMKTWASLHIKNCNL